MSFTLLRPASVEEASRMLLDHGDDARPIAGGTALQIFIHLGLLKVPYLIDLAGVLGLDGVRIDGEWLAIGAMTPLAAVARDPLVGEHLPALADTYRRVANPRVRTTATAGGNLCHGDYRLDPPAMLLPLGAELDLASAAHTRRLPLAEFFAGLEET
ncbi:MAG TPA: FAD binding domain-containing protein, partial [Chloroflexota bacterium]|nr:FAD binding domain-containing protein [Chloroflexota bacterium]